MDIGKNMEEIMRIDSKYRVPFRLQDEWIKEATFDIGEYKMRHYVGGVVVAEYPVVNNRYGLTNRHEYAIIGL